MRGGRAHLHGELALLEQDHEGVVGLVRHLLAKRFELALANDARVAKPAAVGHDARGGELLALQLLGDDLALPVAHRLAAIVHLEPLDLHSNVQDLR